MFTPRFATALTSATLNQPLWLNLNYAPPPVFTNPSTFPQYQVSEQVPAQLSGVAIQGGAVAHKEPHSQRAVDSLVNFFMGAPSDQLPDTRAQACTHTHTHTHVCIFLTFL